MYALDPYPFLSTFIIPTAGTCPGHSNLYEYEWSPAQEFNLNYQILSTKALERCKCLVSMVSLNIHILSGKETFGILS